MIELPYVIAGPAPPPRHRDDPAAAALQLNGRTSREACDLGIALVPADRAREAIIPDFCGQREPDALRPRPAQLRAASSARRPSESWSSAGREQLGIVTASSDALISTLSGGNQQKVVVARCLARDPELLVLAEPTAGVDIGTRVAIYELIAGLARDGLTVVVSSSDLGDLLAMCTRIVVLREGRVGRRARRRRTY